MSAGIYFTPAALRRKAETVYGLMTGEFNLAVYTPPEACRVRDEYTAGIAARLWEQLYAARSRLCARTGLSEEDEDLQTMLDAGEALTQYLAVQMYCCGARLEQPDARYSTR